MIGSWFLIRRAWQTRDTRNLVGTVPYAFALCLTCTPDSFSFARGHRRGSNVWPAQT